MSTYSICLKYIFVITLKDEERAKQQKKPKKKLALYLKNSPLTFVLSFVLHGTVGPNESPLLL